MLNTAALMGRLVADPELRHTANDVSVTSFTLAVDRSYVKEGSNRQADFIDIIAWRNTADFVCKYFRKGQLVAVEGSIQTRSYTDSQNNKRKAVEVIASAVHFAEPKRQARPEEPSSPPPAYQHGNAEDFENVPTDDDLPF